MLKSKTSLDVRRRTKATKPTLIVFFEEGVFRGEFVEKYDNQDLSSQFIAYVCSTERGKKDIWRVVLRSSNEVDFYQKTSLSKKRQTNSLKYLWNRVPWQLEI